MSHIFFDESGNKTFALFQYYAIRNKDNTLKISLSALLWRNVIGYFFLVSKSEIVYEMHAYLKPCEAYRIILMQNVHITHQMKFFMVGGLLCYIRTHQMKVDPLHNNPQCVYPPFLF